MGKRVTYSQIAYDTIKNSILSGQQEGYINGRQIAADLDMGFTPVREALEKLVQEGLLERIKNSGYFVKHMDERAIAQLYQIRECVELFIWRQLFDTLDAGDVECMELIHEQEMAALQDGDYQLLHELDVRFHAVVIERYANEDLCRLYYSSRERQKICVRYSQAFYQNSAIHEHGEILRHIRAGEKEATLNALQKHIMSYKERFANHFG